jgi:hypothetical protein
MLILYQFCHHVQAAGSNYKSQVWLQDCMTRERALLESFKAKILVILLLFLWTVLIFQLIVQATLAT